MRPVAQGILYKETMSITTHGYIYNGKRYEEQEEVCKAVIDDFMKQHPNLIGVSAGSIFEYQCYMKFDMSEQQYRADYNIFLKVTRQRWGIDIEAFFCVAPNCTYHVETKDYFYIHPFPRT